MKVAGLENNCLPNDRKMSGYFIESHILYLIWLNPPSSTVLPPFSCFLLVYSRGSQLLQPKFKLFAKGSRDG